MKNKILKKYKLKKKRTLADKIKNKPPKDNRPIKTYTENGIDYVEYPNDMDEYNVLLKLLEESLKE